MADSHTQREDFPWMIVIPDHPPREESTGYRHSRALMQKLVATTPDWMLGGTGYQDHHGGSVWVKDDQGWLCLQLPLGIEWSAQFCADPAKVDRLRLYARRVVAAYPDTLAGYTELGYDEGSALLETGIVDGPGVAAWTDSIFNASFPLPAGSHTGVLPKGAGYHHYPKPIVDIDHFRFDDFNLFVDDPTGLPAVVVPVGRRGSGDGRVRLLGAHPDSAYVKRLPGQPERTDDLSIIAAADTGSDILGDTDPLAQQAFARQR